MRQNVETEKEKNHIGLLLLITAACLILTGCSLLARHADRTMGEVVGETTTAAETTAAEITIPDGITSTEPYSASTDEAGPGGVDGPAPETEEDADSENEKGPGEDYSLEEILGQLSRNISEEILHYSYDDYDGDGHKEVIALSYDGENLRFYQGNGYKTESFYDYAVEGRHPEKVRFVDITNRAGKDLAVNVYWTRDGITDVTGLIFHSYTHLPAIVFVGDHYKFNLSKEAWIGYEFENPVELSDGTWNYMYAYGHLQFENNTYVNYIN